MTRADSGFFFFCFFFFFPPPLDKMATSILTGLSCASLLIVIQRWFRFDYLAGVAQPDGRSEQLDFAPSRGKSTYSDETEHAPFALAHGAYS